MRFAVLGPLEVRSASGLVAIRGGKERRLLGLLLSRANSVVPVGDIIEGLWGASPPPSAAKSVQVYVVRVRKMLAPNGANGAVARRGAGYVLRTARDHVDALEFADLVGRAGEAAAAGAHDVAAVVLRSALGLWRGAPYADFQDTWFGATQAAHLGEMRLAAVEARIEADLVLGRHAEVTAELESLVREHPLRERLWAQLMLALYRSGRQSDALRAFQRARDHLVGEIGVEPGPELRAMEAAVLAQDPGLAAPDPRAAGPPELPTRLRRAGPALTGRDEILRDLHGLWAEAEHGRGGAVLVSGPARSGRTRVAAELACHAHARGAVVHLGGLGPAELTDVVRSAGARPVLVIFDDAEWGGPGTAAALETAAAATSPFRLLALATYDPAHADAWLRAVELRVGHARRMSLPPLEDSDAASIVRACAGGRADADVVGRIVAQAHGLPGRLHELAAARMEVDASLRMEELAVEPGLQLRPLRLRVLRRDTAQELPQPAAQHRTASPPARPAEEAASTGSGPDAPARGRRYRARWAVLALGGGVALAALAITSLFSHTTAHGALNENLALISPSGAVQASVPLRARPASVAAGSGAVWVAEADAGLVVRVNPARRAVAATIPAGTRPSRIITAGGQVWVADPADRTLSRIDPQTNTLAQTIALSSPPSDVLASAGSLWVATRGGTMQRIDPANGHILGVVRSGGTVQRIDPANGHILGVVRTGGDPSGLAATAGAVWVATDQSGTVKRIDARTGAVTGTIRVGDAPAAISAGAAGLWVLDPLDATVSRVDPRRDAVVATVPLGGAPEALAQSGGNVWIADGRNGGLLRLDPRRDAVTRFRLTNRPSALAAASGGLWAGVDAAGASHRGGTLTSINSYAAVDTVDPAASTSPNVAPPQLFGLTNDGLVTLNHVAGPAGTRLVPDLALALPEPAGNGRTYTFHLRPGIRYSTGAPVRPSDVTRSFERLFQLHSSGAAYYQAIDGAAACQKAPKSCDLSRGIVADDGAGTVTFHLTQPDPDFLYKLTLAYADVLPASTPGRQAPAPLPATGPYMITRYVPGRELLLTRNPRFEEWSAAAQPAGYPDRIVIRLGFTPAQGAAAVAHGTGDFMPSLGRIPGHTAYFLHHRGQLRINPVMITGFMFLNVNTPPFNQLRVRQAVNLALDRGQVVNGYGGPGAAQPTCQILPPYLPGYHRYCPYTRDPAADGRWRRPDLARARRLVAASGTAGMKITVWTTPSPPTAVAETRDAVTALRQLGYRASLRLLPDSTYFTYTNDSRNHAQVIDGGWGADYPSADDFLGKLTCSQFAPRSGQATTDASEFCDPALDKQIARAAQLQSANPPAAAAAWARLDRQLTNLAIWLPTVTPNETDLISRRTGNYQYNPVWGALTDQLWVH